MCRMSATTMNEVVRRLIELCCYTWNDTYRVSSEESRYFTFPQFLECITDYFDKFNLDTSLTAEVDPPPSPSLSLSLSPPLCPSPSPPLSPSLICVICAMYDINSMLFVCVMCDMWCSAIMCSALCDMCSV